MQRLASPIDRFVGSGIPIVPPFFCIFLRTPSRCSCPPSIPRRRCCNRWNYSLLVITFCFVRRFSDNEERTRWQTEEQSVVVASSRVNRAFENWVETISGTGGRYKRLIQWQRSYATFFSPGRYIPPKEGSDRSSTTRATSVRIPLFRLTRH